MKGAFLLTRSKYISLLLAVLLVFGSFVFPVSVKAEADYSGLNLHQQYYLRLLGSYSRADYYETNILASVTLAQAIYEGGWGSYSLPIGGNNLFGIKAYSSWDGKVYNQNTSLLYNSYGDFLVSLGQLEANETSAWRAHDSWAESVRIHSKLFLESSRYTAVAGEKDYAKALQAIVDGGYCNDDGYVQEAIRVLERYNLTYYDDITPDSDGIVALTADTERVRLDIGQACPITLTYYPANKAPSKITWASDNPSVATVDQNGNVKAVSHGTAFITATLANGREACCIVYVDCNATIMNSNVFVRTTPSVTASTVGKIYRGCGVKVTSDAIYTDSEGNEYMAITGYNNEGDLVSGYVLAEFVYLNKRNVTTITAVKDDITLTPNQSYQIPISVASADAVDAKLNWKSDNTQVATVNENGVVTALKEGTATITASASGGASKSISLTVASKQKDYVGIITSSDGLRVREAADWEAASLGSIDFLSDVTVHGEPQGFWYKVTGTTTRNKVVTGYVFSTYLKLISDGTSHTPATITMGVSVYQSPDIASEKLGALADNSSIVIIGKEADGWNYVMGKSASGDSIYGYAKLDGSAEIGGEIGGGAGEGIPSGSWYAIANVTDTLNIRESASTSAAVLGEIPGGERLVVISNDSGWCKVNYNGVTGYASADYISNLYKGKVINIDDNLNVRAQPSTSAEIVGKLQNDNEVTIIGEVSNNWYQIETDSLAGYCSADYIQVIDKIYAPATPGGGNYGDFSITNEKLVLSGGLLTGVYAKTTVSELLKSFTGNVSILDSEGNAVPADSFVGTNYRLCVSTNNLDSVVARIVVKGDVNGNGAIDARDYLLIKRAFFGTHILNNAYYKAALVSGKEELNVRDYLLVKRSFFGTYTIK